MVALYLLFESSSGYALFEKAKAEEIEISQTQHDITDLKKFGELVKLKGAIPSAQPISTALPSRRRVPRHL